MVWADVKSSAEFLLRVHGFVALEVALKRVDDCTLFGDREGEQIWGEIVSLLTLDRWDQDGDLGYTLH